MYPDTLRCGVRTSLQSAHSRRVAHYYYYYYVACFWLEQFSKKHTHTHTQSIAHTMRVRSTTDRIENIASSIVRALSIINNIDQSNARTLSCDDELLCNRVFFRSS